MLEFKWEKEFGTERKVSKVIRPFLFMTVGAVFLVVSIVTEIAIQSTSAQIQSYQAGQCTIQAKQMLEDQYEDSNSEESLPTYRPDFQFIVHASGGKEYQSQGYNGFSIFYSDKSGQQAIIDQYVIGKTYPCWYDQADPRRAVLTRQTSGVEHFFAVPFFFGGVVFLTVGIWFHWLRRKRSSQDPSKIVH